MGGVISPSWLHPSAHAQGGLQPDGHRSDDGERGAAGRRGVTAAGAPAGPGWLGRNGRRSPRRRSGQRGRQPRASSRRWGRCRGRSPAPRPVRGWGCTGPVPARARPASVARAGGARPRWGSARRRGGSARRARSATSTACCRSRARGERPRRAGCRPGLFRGRRGCWQRPPPSRTSRPSAAARAWPRTSSGVPSTKWNVVSARVKDRRRWWVSTKTGVWKGGSSPHQPCHSSSVHGPRCGPNLLRPTISAPMLW